MKLFQQNDKPLKLEELAKLSPERTHIAKVFKKHIDAVVVELGTGYDVTLQGSFASTPIRIVVEVKATNDEMP